MRRRRIVLVGGLLLALMAALVTAGSIWVLRTCDQSSNVQRGSFAFRLCNMDGELIASLPVRDPQNGPTFAWQNADGNKPGRRWVSYASSAPSAELRQQLIGFLQQAGFAPQGHDGAFELWADGHTLLAFEIQSADDGKSNRVEIVHNTGLD